MLYVPFVIELRPDKPFNPFVSRMNRDELQNLDSVELLLAPKPRVNQDFMTRVTPRPRFCLREATTRSQSCLEPTVTKERWYLTVSFLNLIPLDFCCKSHQFQPSTTCTSPPTTWLTTRTFWRMILWAFCSLHLKSAKHTLSETSSKTCTLIRTRLATLRSWLQELLM